MKSDLNTIILFANIIITVISVIGAYRSLRYYKKSKHITTYTQTRHALDELGEMLNILPKALAEVSEVKKGYSPENTIRDRGTELANHLNRIMSELPGEYSSEFASLQKNNEFDLSQYINSFIDGSVIVEENERKTLERTSFDTCQERLRAMQVYLKAKIDEEEEKLK